MTKSYNGKILHIDLTEETVRIEEPNDVFYRTYLGGRNIVGYYLLKDLPDGVEPLSPDNMLVFATSVLTGLPVCGVSRNSIGAKSPVTGGWADSEVGGYWGAEFKAAGYDAMVVRGRAKKPVYIWIKDGAVEIKSAEALWGMKTAETEEALRKELGDSKIRVSQIGPGGENLIQYSCIIQDLHFAAGRNGLGAVMGSKNLKAVAVRGTKKPEGADPEAVKIIAKKAATGWKTNREKLGLHGTSMTSTVLQNGGQLPTRNFQQGLFEGAEKISGPTMTDTILTGTEGCYACSIRCKRVVEAESHGRKADPIYGGPEYETLAVFGSNLGCDDLSAIAAMNSLCNAYGVDTISAGMSISFLTECYQKGFIDTTKTDGLELKFGDADLALTLLEKIVRREGVGDVLARGVQAALEYVGPAAKDIAIHVKGQYVPMHDPRGKNGIALAYAMSPGGADHLQSSHDGNLAAPGKVLDEFNPIGIYEPIQILSLGMDKVRYYFRSHLWIGLLNVLDFCWYVASPPSVLTPDDVQALLRGATGWNINMWEMLKASERGHQMARIFNCRNGVGPEKDVLPERFFTPITAGPLQGKHVDRKEFEEAKSMYYEMMGWDRKTGMPSLGRIVDLGLEWAVPGR
jgi:aldehyde:ferredoxin oxidoreductase